MISNKNNSCKLPRGGAMSPTLAQIRALTRPVFDELKTELTRGEKVASDYIQMPMLFTHLVDNQRHDNEETFDDHLKEELEQAKVKYRDRPNLVKRFLRDYDIARIREQLVLNHFTSGHKINSNEINDSKINSKISTNIEGVCYRKCAKKPQVPNKWYTIARPQGVLSSTNLNHRTDEFYKKFAKDSIENDKLKEVKSNRRLTKRRLTNKFSSSMLSRLSTEADSTKHIETIRKPLKVIREEKVPKIAETCVTINESEKINEAVKKPKPKLKPIRVFSKTSRSVKRPTNNKQMRSCCIHVHKAKGQEKCVAVQNDPDSDKDSLLSISDALTSTNQRFLMSSPKVNKSSEKKPFWRKSSHCVSPYAASKMKKLDSAKIVPSLNSARLQDKRKSLRLRSAECVKIE